MNALNTALQSTQTTVQETLLSLPQQLKAQLPLSAPLKLQIAEQRQTIQNILDGKDHRLMVITGPCSIHDPIAVLEYAEKLKQLQAKVSDQIFFVMRAYIEKPRTTVGWKGFLYDPLLDGSSNMQLGLEQSRALYLAIIEMGLPIATEILSPMATAYFDDLLAWGAIGARTSESQIHREISSHMPFSMFQKWHRWFNSNCTGCDSVCIKPSPVHGNWAARHGMYASVPRKSEATLDFTWCKLRA